MKNWVKKALFGASVLGTSVLASAQATLPTALSEAQALASEQMTGVGTNGASALVIGAGLALGTVIISFIYRAKR